MTPHVKLCYGPFVIRAMHFESMEKRKERRRQQTPFCMWLIPPNTLLNVQPILSVTSITLPLSRSLELSIEARCLMIDASNERREKGEAEKAWLLLLGDSTIRHLRLLRLWLPSNRDSNTWSEDRRRRSTGEDDYDREKTDAAGNDFQRP